MEGSDHFTRFRALAAPQVKRRLRDHPVITERDWVIECYFSQEKFESRFPDIQQREEWLSELEQKSEGLASASRMMTPDLIRRIFKGTTRER